MQRFTGLAARAGMQKHAEHRRAAARHPRADRTRRFDVADRLVDIRTHAPGYRLKHIAERPAEAAHIAALKRALRRIEEMIDGGEYKSARSMLMNLATRCAEWNYLFGAVLLNLSELDKALMPVAGRRVK